jgi:hypothetical protein
MPDTQPLTDEGGRGRPLGPAVGEQSEAGKEAARQSARDVAREAADLPDAWDDDGDPEACRAPLSGAALLV